MAKQQKAKTSKGVTNDARRNKKAFKKPDGVKHRKSPQSEIAKILLNGGAYVNVKKRWAANA